MGSLYERLGGEAAINAAVDGFYEKVRETRPAKSTKNYMRV
jgi:truncated hemoglobin YjbI